MTVRGGPATPIALSYQGSPTMHAGTTDDGGSGTNYVVQIAANSNRQMGVWIQCTHSSARKLLIRPEGATSGAFVLLASYQETTTLGNFDLFFIPGQGGIELKDNGNNTTTTWVAMEF